MAFISNKKNTSQASQSQSEFCKAVADLFQHSRDAHEKFKIDRSVQYNRTVPCRFGEKCKKIDPNTGFDTCTYANTLDKLRGKPCRQDGACDQYTKGSCKWYHEKQGQTMAEYAAFNGWFQKAPASANQDNMQLETDESMLAEQQVWQQGVLAEMSRVKQGVPPANYAAECNRRVSKLYEEQFADEIEREMEEVCDEIDKEAHEYEFEQEVSRIYQDPDEVELDEKIAILEMHQLTCDIHQYMYNSYGLVY
jgi:hypothetical protein